MQRALAKPSTNEQRKLVGIEIQPRGSSLYDAFSVVLHSVFNEGDPRAWLSFWEFAAHV
jgi:hypothetical protein